MRSCFLVSLFHPAGHNFQFEVEAVSEKQAAFLAKQENPSAFITGVKKKMELV